MKQLLQEYLSAPNEKRSSTIERMLLQPDEAFDALLHFRGPYPDHLCVVDVFPDYLAPVLTQIMRKFPRLLLNCDISKRKPGERWILISAAIEAECVEFAPIILAALKDRSIAVRILAVKAVARYQFLQTPYAKEQLRRFLTLRSMAYSRNEVQKALDACKGEKNNDD